VIKTTIFLLTLALTTAPAVAQSIQAVKDAEWCRAFDPQTKDPECIFPVVREPPVPIRPAEAGTRPLYILPPVEYDHPYTGNFFETVVDSQDEVRKLCPSTRNLLIGVSLACTRRTDTSCWMVIANDDVIKSVGHVPEVVRRHEIGLQWLARQSPRSAAVCGLGDRASAV
jgi:hypothetical protein